MFAAPPHHNLLERSIRWATKETRYAVISALETSCVDSLTLESSVQSNDTLPFNMYCVAFALYFPFVSLI